MNKKVLISLHDVTPYHLTRILKAEQSMKQWGVEKISFCFVPEYHKLHRKNNKQLFTDFYQWILEKKNYDIEWILHGYYHLEDKNSDVGQRFSILNRIWKNTFHTANEAEFLHLTSGEINERLQRGKEAFLKNFHRNPDVFVSPAWLFDKRLITCLQSNHFEITEDHSGIYLLKQNRFISAPVITWATRTFLLQRLSRIGCPLLNRLWFYKDLIRIAVHPYDFDFPSTVNSIRKVLTRVLEKRQATLYRELQNLQFKSDL
jgi:predicted deacetylase